ncbi:hypothetical protein WA577_001503, partial [Blastocystis sp. JDR]
MVSRNDEQTTFQYLLSHKRELFRDKGMWLFVFICVVVSAVQLYLGLVTGSLACFTDCIHRGHHIMEYIIIAVATVLQNRQEDSRYSYGYGRHEYLLVFTVNLSAIIMCCFLLFEMIHGVIEGHHQEIVELSPFLSQLSSYMNYVSFAISLITIFGFRWYKQQYRARYSSDIYQVKSTQVATINKEDVFHIFLDLITLGFMMLSNYLSLNRGMVLADHIECGVMCLFIIYQCYPELLTCCQVLVLGVTNDVAQEIRTLVRRVNMLEGVIEVKSTKYWVESPGRLVGLMNVEVHRSADPKQVRTTIQHICSNTF